MTCEPVTAPALGKGQPPETAGHAVSALAQLVARVVTDIMVFVCGE